MNRRSFLSVFGAAAIGATFDLEQLLWVPGKKTIFLPSATSFALDLQFSLLPSATSFAQDLRFPFPCRWDVFLRHYMPQPEVAFRIQSIQNE